MTFQDDILFRNNIVAKFQGPKFKKKGKNLKNVIIFFNFSSNILFIIPYHLTQVLSF